MRTKYRDGNTLVSREDVHFKVNGKKHAILIQYNHLPTHLKIFLLPLQKLYKVRIAFSLEPLFKTHFCTFHFDETADI